MEAKVKDPLRSLKRLTVLNLVLLSVRAWTGDVVNLFAAFPSGAVTGFSGFFAALQGAGPGPLAIWHGVQGMVVIVLAILIAGLCSRSKARSVRIVGLLGLFFTLVAALGGYTFVFSSFLNNGNSAQVGGSFLGAYAMYFLVLYYTK
ncbi:MAG: hypothetical protein LYZ66_04495 [Nitrososphaerales archaeon]|nr:hypothetical protein [Nitrososphaerales archaeon]